MILNSSRFDWKNHILDQMRQNRRIYLSASEPSCRKEYDHPSDKRSFPGLFDFPLRAGRMMNEGFVAYLKQAGLQVSELPIEQGYSSMHTLGQTMKDWIDSGSPVS